MHESSLVRNLLDQVRELLREHRGDYIEQIHVEIGPLSGVEPLLVRSAFEQLAVGDDVSRASLIIHEIPLEARCRRCAAEFVINNYHFVCPHCSATGIQVIRGDEFRLLTIDIHQSASEASA